MRVDVRSNDEAHHVKEWHPDLVGQEGLRESQGNGRCYPRHLHDRHESSFYSGTNLMERACAGDDGHGSQVHGILDGSNL